MSTALARKLRLHWTETHPEPLVMTDREILNWQTEHCEEMNYRLPTPNYAGGFTVKCFGVKTFSPTLRGAICLAAAKYKEEFQ